MKDVIIYGGSFDPPHLIHYEAARMGLVYGDFVWFMPVYKHTEKTLTNSFNFRVVMLRMMLEDHKGDKASGRMSINTFEKSCGSGGQTYTMLRGLIKSYPDCNFKFMMGLDAATDIRSWYKWAELITLLPFIILTRNQEKKEDLPRQWWYGNVDVTIQDMPRWSEGVSSTAIRKQLKDYENNQYKNNPMVEYHESLFEFLSPSVRQVLLAKKMMRGE